MILHANFVLNRLHFAANFGYFRMVLLEQHLNSVQGAKRTLLKLHNESSLEKSHLAGVDLEFVLKNKET